MAVKRKVPKRKSVVRKSAARTTAPRKQRIALLVATRKGAWILHGDSARRSWRTEGPLFLGQIVNHMVLDPRNRSTMLAATSTGHLGPTMHRSTDAGKTWSEVKLPPKFAEAPAGTEGRSVKHTFWLTPAHDNEPGVWYAGTSPQGLFRSSDGGEHWQPFSVINDDPQYRAWFGSEKDGTPDGPKLHSMMIDPRDPKHLYFAISSGGVHESTDGGQSFRPIIKGMAVFGDLDAGNVAFHDPHCVRMAPSNPDRLYQQNHCGIYRLDRPATEWLRVGNAMPPKVGDIGFPIVVHPRDDDTAWVFPMDGQMVWPRTAIAGKPAAYVTRNGGKSWQRQDRGLPTSQAWWTIKRQAMCSDSLDTVGLYVGTSSGEVWASRDEGRNWRCIARHLPEIYAVEAAVL
jgi:photosystem II stability/assembly factor-like uncharacterized protein